MYVHQGTIQSNFAMNQWIGSPSVTTASVRWLQALSRALRKPMCFNKLTSHISLTETEICNLNQATSVLCTFTFLMWRKRFCGCRSDYRMTKPSQNVELHNNWEQKVNTILVTIQQNKSQCLHYQIHYINNAPSPVVNTTITHWMKSWDLKNG